MGSSTDKINKVVADSEAQRIRHEYARREREIPHDYYSPARPANLFIYSQRIRAVLAMMNRQGMFPLAGKNILEVGCGAGNWLLDFVQWGADAQRLAGIDLDESRINRSRDRVPGSDLYPGDASRLPWANASFDIVLQSTVFTSILEDGMKTAVAGEMARVLRPDGMILWYDYFVNNPRNPRVRGIGLKEIRKLFPGFAMVVRKVTLAPPIARLIAPRSWLLCYLLELIPWFRTHYLIAMRMKKFKTIIAPYIQSRNS